MKTHRTFVWILSLFFFPPTGMTNPECKFLLSFPPIAIDREHDGHKIVKLFYRNDKGEVGSIEYSIRKETPYMMSVDWVGTEMSYRRLGVSNHLIKAAANRENGVFEILALLVGINYQVFNSMYGNRENCNEALIDTPFYRSFSAIGFSVIKECRVLHDTVFIVLKRVIFE